LDYLDRHPRGPGCGRGRGAADQDVLQRSGEARLGQDFSLRLTKSSERKKGIFHRDQKNEQLGLLKTKPVFSMDEEEKEFDRMNELNGGENVQTKKSTLLLLFVT